MLLAIFVVLTPIASVWAADKPTVIGILRVYDNSARSLTDSLTPNLTFMIYRDLLENPAYQPMLLSPGGLYDPDALDWMREFAARAKVDVVLISVILPAAKVNERHSRLMFQVRLMNVANGYVSANALNDTIEVADSDLFSSVETGDISSTYAEFFKHPKDFEKRHIGKAALKLAEWTRGYVDSALSGMRVLPTGIERPSKTTTCDIDFQISYVMKRSVSKSYTLIANSMDESSSINDGSAHFSMTSGPLFLKIQVRDAPYGTPLEHLYQVSTSLDCTTAHHYLVMEVGSAGESLLRWR